MRVKGSAMSGSMRWGELRSLGGPQLLIAVAGNERRLREPIQSEGETGGSSPSESNQELTIAEFVARNFLPEHIAAKRTSGRRHYQAILKHVLNPDYVDRIFGASADRSRGKLKVNPDWPYMDNVRLCDVHSDHIRRLVSAALQRGYSTQTAKHIRNVLSAIISHAIKVGFYVGRNPAVQVPAPGMLRKQIYSLTFDQTIRTLQAMRYPERDISLIAILTGMSIAEICGLQWKYVNLTDHTVKREGELIPPKSIAVRKQSYRGELSLVPDGRKKYIPIPYLLRSVLLALYGARNAGWNDFVLVSRTGNPINQINIAARRLKTIGKQLEIPWLSWRVLRRTRSRLLDEYGSGLLQELSLAITLTMKAPAAVDK